MFFQQVEGEAAVLIENGIYKQVDLYTRGGYLYAKVASGFVRLMADGSTTKARCRLEHMSWEGSLYRDPLGRLCTDQIVNSRLRPLFKSESERLLGWGNGK